MKRVTAADAGDAAHASRDGSVFLHRQNEVRAAAWVKPATPAYQQSERPLVTANGTNQAPGRQHPDPSKSFHHNIRTQRCFLRLSRSNSSQKQISCGATHRRQRVIDSQLLVLFSVSPCLRGFSITFSKPPTQLLRKSNKRVLIVAQCRTRFLSGDEYQVEPRWQIVLRQPERLAHQPFQPIAANRVAVLLRYTEAEPR